MRASTADTIELEFTRALSRAWTGTGRLPGRRKFLEIQARTKLNIGFWEIYISGIVRH